MVLYLHKNYKGGFCIDIWSESLQMFEGIPYHQNLDGSLAMATIYAMAERLGARKLVLDF